MFASSSTTSSSQITESDKVGVSILVSMYCIISSSTLPAYFIYVKTSHAEKNKLTVFIFIPSCPELISVTPEAATRGVLSKKMFLKMSEISQKNTCGRSLSLIKLQVFRPTILLRRDSNAGVFRWNLRNFQELLLWRMSANDCFWKPPQLLHQITPSTMRC